MEKVYRQYEDLAIEKKETFDSLLEVQSKIGEKEKELYALQLEKKSIAQKLIVYLKQARYEGIKKDTIIAYLQDFAGGCPSFNQVFEQAFPELCTKDRNLLSVAYATLSEAKEKVTRLVVKGG